jgi:hypothetical protein
VAPISTPSPGFPLSVEEKTSTRVLNVSTWMPSSAVPAPLGVVMLESFTRCALRTAMPWAVSEPTVKPSIWMFRELDVTVKPWLPTPFTTAAPAPLPPALTRSWVKGTAPPGHPAFVRPTLTASLQVPVTVIVSPEQAVLTAVWSDCPGHATVKTAPPAGGTQLPRRTRHPARAPVTIPPLIFIELASLPP